MSKSVGMREVLRRFLPEYVDQHPMDAWRWRICRHLQRCQSAAMGGVELDCGQCGTQSVHYFGCRDRHCPRCQQRATRRWSERQQQDLLEVPYFHLVFTLPHRLNGWARLHPEVIYDGLFKSVWSTLKAFSARARGSGGQQGMIAVLHTWGQNLSQHVHLHCLIPGGRLTAEGEWREAAGGYLYPVRALSRRFRGAMVSRLRASANAGELVRLEGAQEVDVVLKDLMQTEWVVYSRACLSQHHTVIDYLARYTHRIAISDHRIVGIEADRVRFSYLDYADGARRKSLSLAGTEFVRRFLQHTLPKGFVRVRHYGFLAHCCRRKRLAQIRSCLARCREARPAREPRAETPSVPGAGYRCPKCRVTGVRVRHIEAKRGVDSG